MKYINEETYNILRSQARPCLAEKDYLECILLTLLFSDETIFHKYVFSGGASLTKAYNIGNRVCQDIDLVCTDFAEISESRSQKDLRIYKKRFKEYVFDTVLNHVQYILRQDGYFSVITDRQNRIGTKTQSDPVLHIFCNSELNNQQIHICLEIVPRTYPSEYINYCKVTPYCTSNSMGRIPTVAYKQTFWDKIYALHTNSQLCTPFCNNGYSRHYYDVSQLAPFINLQQTQDMLFDIARRQSIYTTRNLPVLKSLTDIELLPNSVSLQKLGSDYCTIQTIDNNTPRPTWADIVATIRTINKKIKTL